MATKSRTPIILKLNGAISIVFILTVIAALSYSFSAESERTAEMGQYYASEATTFYFDSLNTMMLTGTMPERSILRKKMLNRPGIIEARVIRGQPVANQFGPGNEHEKVIDDLDRRALKGETISQFNEQDGQRIVTVITPFFATENTRGVNCLQCHTVPSGSVNGAIRVSYSLEELDNKMAAGHWTTIAVYIVLFAIGQGVLYLFFSNSLVNPIRALQARLQEIARGDGDLTVSLECRNHDELGDVANEFNTFTAKLRTTISEIKQSASALNNNAEHISTLSTQTANSANSQYSELDQTASAINQMSATVQEVANNAATAAETARQADDEANRGQAIVQQTVDSINKLATDVTNASDVIDKLGQETGNIGSILDVVKDIADQTNLLALNAAIEAARAGEHGRGFAVVADEVRGLAARTQESISEIHHMIESLQAGAKEAGDVMNAGRKQAESSVEQAASAGEAITAITAQVDIINDMNTQIASAAEQQSAVSEEVNRNIQNINQMADQTSENAQQASTASQQLSGAANKLSELLNQFKV
ncbi:MAG TPA: methyl-accepting chemotaxis protein [Candidatus Tenderia electrophaga]|uniref:Methyl-accepting chemotaxis protein n=1 Tax=Candidatus Tenderia electrophaga TaxID=1748243 RepID=A0A832N3A5_9GAMM|nr:methyl-accepting chemotaxis protein [Candidatus Tenderia electrophaga]